MELGLFFFLRNIILQMRLIFEQNQYYFSKTFLHINMSAYDAAVYLIIRGDLRQGFFRSEKRYFSTTI